MRSCVDNEIPASDEDWSVDCEHAHNFSSKWARPGDRLHCTFQVPSRARPGPSLPLPTGLGPPESSTGPSPVDTFTLPRFLPSRARPGSSPLDLWQCKRGLRYTYTYTYTYTDIYIYTCIYTDIYTYAYTYTDKYTDTYTYTYIYTYTYRCT